MSCGVMSSFTELQIKGNSGELLVPVFSCGSSTRKANGLIRNQYLKKKKNSNWAG